MEFGTDTYCHGALERIGEARLLKDEHQYTGSIYLAGLAVEGMLRSLHWLKDRAFDPRHDLKRIAVRIQDLGLLRSGARDDDFVATVQEVAQNWSNDLRFADNAKTQRWLFKKRAIRKDQERFLKKACEDHLERCFEVVERCRILWQRHRRSD